MPGEKKKKVPVRLKKVTQKALAAKATKPLAKKPSRTKPTTNAKRKPTTRKAVVRVKTAVRVPVIVDTQPLQSPIPLRPLPAPLMKAAAKRPAHHPWSLRHHTFGILAITFVATAAMFLLTAFTDVVTSDIDAYGTASTSLIIPTPTNTNTYVTPAGNMEVIMPTTWSMAETTADTVTYLYTSDPVIKLTLSIQEQDSSSVLTWLQSHEQTYVNGEVVTPSMAVSKKQGIMITGTTKDNEPLQAAYWLQTGNNGKTYIVIATLVYNDTIAGKVARQDMERAIGNIAFASAQQ